MPRNTTQAGQAINNSRLELKRRRTESRHKDFKNVCNAAKTLTDQNQSAFKHYWSKRIGCELHQQNARLCLQRTASLRRKLKRLPVTSDDVLQYQQLQTDLPSSVSIRSEYRDRQRHNGAVLRARGLRQRRRMI